MFGLKRNLRIIEYVLLILASALIAGSISSLMSLGEDAFILIFVILLLFVVVTRIIFNSTVISSRASKTEINIAILIDQLRRQMFLAAVLTFASGMASVFFTAQTIYKTGSSQADFSGNRDLSFALKSAMEQRESVLSELSRSNEPVNEEIFKEIFSKLNSEISSTRNLISRDGGRSVTNEDGSISSEFLFQFFSDLFVRLGTIAVIMLIFGICFAQFRRLSKRYQEVHQMKLFVAMLEDDIDEPKMKALKETLYVSDEPQKIDKDSLETAFADHVNQAMSGWFDKLAAMAKKEERTG